MKNQSRKRIPVKNGVMAWNAMATLLTERSCKKMAMCLFSAECWSSVCSVEGSDWAPAKGSHKYHVGAGAKAVSWRNYVDVSRKRFELYLVEHWLNSEKRNTHRTCIPICKRLSAPEYPLIDIHWSINIPSWMLDVARIWDEVLSITLCIREIVVQGIWISQFVEAWNIRCVDGVEIWRLWELQNFD